MKLKFIIDKDFIIKENYKRKLRIEKDNLEINYLTNNYNKINTY
jgi:hypothetical protein|tara:strand:- start:42 stop:173 length:132 start_codon:yes stop_codon:yes gene_type:complete